MKQIRSAADLAANGASPAFLKPVHVGTPNLGPRHLVDRHLDSIYETKWLSNHGPLVREFEARVERYLGVAHCIALCNGTVALEVAIRAMGLQGEVIVPSFTFVATAHALQWQQITPVFADIDERTHNLDPVAVRRMITPRTTGIIGVHLWGRPAPCDELQDIANEHGLQVMYDAAHAFGCGSGGTMIGNFGACEVLSFHATKFFNTGEGGAIVTNDSKLAERIRLMTNFGFAGYDNVIHIGINGKMSELSAAMGLANFEAMDDVVAINRANHAQYAARLSDVRGVRLIEFDAGQSNNHQYVVAEILPKFATPRDAVIAALHAENVLARKYFWPGCHRMQPYRDLFPHAGLLLPVTERIAGRVVVLPTGTGVDATGIDLICDVLACLQDAPPAARDALSER